LRVGGDGDRRRVAGTKAEMEESKMNTVVAHRKSGTQKYTNTYAFVYGVDIQQGKYVRAKNNARTHVYIHVRTKQMYFSTHMIRRSSSDRRLSHTSSGSSIDRLAEADYLTACKWEGFGARSLTRL
jgi:hypothetical protein